MRLRVTEENQQAVSEELRDVATEPRDRLGSHVVVAGYDLAPVFGVKIPGYSGRAYQVAEQNR